MDGNKSLGNVFLIDPEMISLQNSNVVNIMWSLYPSGELYRFSHPIYINNRIIYLDYKEN